MREDPDPVKPMPDPKPGTPKPTRDTPLTCETERLMPAPPGGETPQARSRPQSAARPAPTRHVPM